MHSSRQLIVNWLLSCLVWLRTIVWTWSDDTTYNPNQDEKYRTRLILKSLIRLAGALRLL